MKTTTEPRKKARPDRIVCGAAPPELDIDNRPEVYYLNYKRPMKLRTSLTPSIIPFLKWAGGKRWLARDLGAFIGEVSGRYFEPFLGSGALYFSLLPQRAILSDINSDLITTYSAIRRSWRFVVAKLNEHQALHSSEYYYKIRESKLEDDVDQAARFIYLNRTCWNGLYRVNLKGQFNVPIGTKTAVILPSDDFRALARQLKGAELVSSDFERQLLHCGRGDVVFADPPYTVRHKFNGFVKYNEQLFSWDDQVRLRDALMAAKRRHARIYLTNADHSSIWALYEHDFHIERLDRYSSIGGKKAVRGTFPELLIYS